MLSREIEIDPYPVVASIDGKSGVEFRLFFHYLSTSGEIKRIVIIAPGGRGKTMASIRLMIEWALGVCL